MQRRRVVLIGASSALIAGLRFSELMLDCPSLQSGFLQQYPKPA
jgi:hypothetical protein